MKFYLDILREKLDKKLLNDTHLYHYHIWTSKSIKKFWQISTSSLVNEQFYPIEYWYDIVNWAISNIKHLNKIKKICDVGCGTGNMIKVLSEKFPKAEILGIDLTEDSMKFAIYRFKNNERIKFKVGSITEIPADDGSLDLITVTEVLEHLFLEDFYKGFNEISKKLKIGGYLLATLPFEEKLTFVSCPECGSLFNPYQHMIFEITYNDIKNICRENGLKIVCFYQAFNREEPKGSTIKKFLKIVMIKLLPRDILCKLFPKHGTTGFLAKKL